MLYQGFSGPTASPIKSIEELDNFSKVLVNKNALSRLLDPNLCFIPVSPNKHEAKDEDACQESKVMVCHDQSGKYNSSDVYTQGILGEEAQFDLECQAINQNSTPVKDEDSHIVYEHISWTAIDSFIYFSHTRIASPPVCWRNADSVHELFPAPENLEPLV